MYVRTTNLYMIRCWTGNQCSWCSNGLAWNRLGAWSQSELRCSELAAVSEYNNNVLPLSAPACHYHRPLFTIKCYSADNFHKGKSSTELFDCWATLCKNVQEAVSPLITQLVSHAIFVLPTVQNSSIIILYCENAETNNVMGRACRLNKSFAGLCRKQIFKMKTFKTNNMDIVRSSCGSDCPATWLLRSQRN